MADIEVQALDHIVLVTPDVERALAWWTDVLGLEPVRVDEWRRGDAPFPSVRIDAGSIIDLVHGDRNGVNVEHVCLVVRPDDIDVVRGSGRFRIVHDDPGSRPFGARGHARAVYVADPDDNTVELRSYA